MRIPAKAIPRFNGLKEKISGDADNSDLRAAIMAAVPEAVEQTKQLASYFQTTSDRETAKKIFDYLKKNVKYKADDYRQVIQLPSAIMQPGSVTDCKSLSLFTAAILQNLGIPWHFVLASYTDSPIPGHIYVQTDSGVIIDVVWGKFNSEKKPKYRYKMDYKRNDAGLGGADPIGNIFKKGQQLIQKGVDFAKEQTDELARKAREEADRLAREAAARAAAEAERLRKQAGQLQGRIETGFDKFKTWTSDYVQKVIQGAKTIGLGPGRNLFLIVVKNNFDGLANKLSRINQDELRSAWNKAGGNWTNLTDAIRKGASKRSINIGFLKGLESLTKISGIGAVDAQQLISLLSRPEVQAAIISLSGGVGTAVGAAGGSATGPGAIATGAAGGTAGTSMGAVINVMVKILPAVLAMMTDQDRANQQAIPPGFDNMGDDQGSTDTGNLTPILIGGAVIAGLALVYFATKKKK
jgi:hypothetical protein